MTIEALTIEALYDVCLGMQAGTVRTVFLQEEPIHGELGALRFKLIKFRKDGTQFSFSHTGKQVVVQCNLQQTAGR